MKKIDKNTIIRNIIISVLLVGITITVLIYVRTQTMILSFQMEDMIARDSKEVSDIIDASVLAGQNSIQAAAMAIGIRLSESDAKIISAGYIINEEYVESTPFRRMAVVSKSGTGYYDNGMINNMADMQYFKEGINGKTGVLVSNEDILGNEPLLFFYTPVVCDHEIEGVVIGIMEGNSDIGSLFIKEMSGQPVISVVMDSENRLIASTESFENGTIITRENLEVMEKEKDKFFKAIEVADGQPFYINKKMDRALASVCRIETTGWKLVQIVPSNSIKNIFEKSTRLSYWTIGLIILYVLLICYIIIVDRLRKGRNDLNKAHMERDEHIAVLLAMSDIYYSMHVINLIENTVIEYAARNEVKQIANDFYKEDAARIMYEVMSNTITDEYKEAVMEFSDVTTVAERLKGKKIISSDFIGKNIGLFRASFIPIEKDENGYPQKVIFTTRILNDKKSNTLY